TAFDRTSNETVHFFSKKLSANFTVEERFSRNEIFRINQHILVVSTVSTRSIDESLDIHAPPLSEVTPELLDVSTVINPKYKGRFSKGPPARLFNFKYTRHIGPELLRYDNLTIPPLRLDETSSLDQSIQGLPGFRRQEG